MYFSSIKPRAENENKVKILRVHFLGLQSINYLYLDDNTTVTGENG